jgi:hypothetical protein
MLTPKPTIYWPEVPEKAISDKFIHLFHMPSCNFDNLVEILPYGY